jgi:hypothetical protein
MPGRFPELLQPSFADDPHPAVPIRPLSATPLPFLFVKREQSRAIAKLFAFSHPET